MRWKIWPLWGNETQFDPLQAPNRPKNMCKRCPPHKKCVKFSKPDRKTHKIDHFWSFLAKVGFLGPSGLAAGLDGQGGGVAKTLKRHISVNIESYGP